MLVPADHAFFVVLAVLFPLWAALFGMRRLRRATWDELPRARMALYRRAIGIQWTLAFTLIAYWLYQGRGWADLGLALHLTPGFIGILVGLGIMTVLVLRQRGRALRDEHALEQVRSQLARLALLLPRTPAELRWFYALSITAGICEELLYRGYMIWYLAHGMGLIPAIAVAALVFGLAHAYQGPRGMMLTAAVGLFLGGAYLVSGSLFMGMLAHALMDLHSGHLGYVALTRSESAPEGDDSGEAEHGWEQDAEAAEDRALTDLAGSSEPR